MLDGVVYKLFSKNPDDNEYYIGSTNNIHRRQKEHKSCCNNKNSSDYNKKVYKYIRENGGFDKFDFEILEIGEYEDKKLLHERERFFIEQNKPSLNNNIPNRTKEEWREVNKENKKEHYQKNKEHYKEHYQKNKEIINNRAKEHYQNNKEKIKEYYQKNKEKINEKKREKITCEVCNCVITNGVKARHNKSQRHLNNFKK